MDYMTFFKNIKNNSLSGAYLMHGEEEFIKDSALRALKDTLDEVSRELNLQTLETATADEIISACETLPFFAHIAKLKCLAFAEKQKWQWRSPGLDARTMRQYVQREAQALGLRMAPEALNTLSEMLIPDASAIRGVLEQLSLASADGAVDVALVRQMTEFTPDAVIFDFIRQLENGNARAVWKTLLREGDGGESLLFPLLTLMAREARLLWQMNAGEKVFVPQYVEAEKRRLAAKLGVSGLSQVLQALAAAECSVKSGARTPLQAMESLVAQLSLIFGAPSR